MILPCAAVTIPIRYHHFMLSKYIDFHALQTSLGCSWVVNLPICTFGGNEPCEIPNSLLKTLSDMILGRAWHSTYLNASELTPPLSWGTWPWASSLTFLALILITPMQIIMVLIPQVVVSAK